MLLCGWELVSSTGALSSHALPAPTAVLTQAWEDGFYLTDVATTLSEAARGWLIGNAAALALAFVCTFVRPVRRSLLRLTVATYCIPTIAIGPLLVLLVSLDTTKVILAALSVFFTTLVAMVLGLESADPRHLDLIRAFGGGPWMTARKVRLRAALPATFSGLALAAPAALLGAMIGDYLGGHRGLGVVMLQAQASLHVDRVWAVGLVATGVSGGAFALTALLGRRLSSGLAVGNLEAGEPTPARRDKRPRPSHSPLRRAAALLATLAALVAIWWAAIPLLGLDPYFAKTPLAVWRGLSNVHPDGTTGSLLLAGARTTLLDSVLGYLAGTAAAMAIAVAIATSGNARSLATPLIVMLRAVPLVAMTPVLALLCGTGTLLITAVAAIVVLVPTVVTVNAGMASVPSSAQDLFCAYGGGRWAELCKLRLPYAIPSLFAAARVAMPGAILGAVLAEWLLTDSGLGHLLAVAVIDSDFTLQWGALALATGMSIVLYHLATEGEALTLERVRQ
ncbi:MAG TPA: ABC transporter permease subunit [Solirubrobacteraceae bacterium]|nr:ABC transporter permease subunit [Solirubrobacteraceae bacterium]